MGFVMKIANHFLHRAESEKINAEIGAALKDLKASAAEAAKTQQARFAPNAAFRDALDKAKLKLMTENFADFEKLIRRRNNRVH